jgi:hypothetical protein
MAAAAFARAKPKICQEKQSLGYAFIEALRTVMNLQNAEAAVLVQGAPGLERFELAIQRARERRDQAKLAYILHISRHGC